MREYPAQRRKRGVRASRARLHRALIGAGLKSQSALAARIADLEGLEVEPKDLVNRIFRERPVEYYSLERIAHALGVEAYSLYLSEAELQARDQRADCPDTAPTDRQQASTQRQHRSRGLWPLWLGLVACIAVFTGIFTSAWGLTPLPCWMREILEPDVPAKQTLGVVIARFEHDPTDIGQDFLAMNFATDTRLAPYLTVIKTCRRFAVTGPGDIGRQRRAIRRHARQLLRDRNALVLLWGRLEGDRLVVRFVSAEPDARPAKQASTGQVESNTENRLEVRFPLDHPANATRAVKTTTLRLMRPRAPAKKRVQKRVAQTMID